MLDRLKAVLRWFASTRATGRSTQDIAAEKEGGTFAGPTASKARYFEADYHSATQLLRDRMNKRYPDNYHARLSSGTNAPYDYGEQRAAAVDTASTAIAMALRNGASVQEAANAGAASVGI